MLAKIFTVLLFISEMTMFARFKLCDLFLKRSYSNKEFARYDPFQNGREADSPKYRPGDKRPHD